MRALIHLSWPGQGERGRLALSVLLAAAATGASVALMATSGYLISRAAQRPLMISLMVTITAVRAFGISRAVLRYGERLASHDLALRRLANLRLHFYERLAPLVPGQVGGRSRGDLMARFVGDVDTLQDSYLRVIIPTLVAVVVILGASVAAWLMLPAAGAVVVCALALGATLSPWASGRIAASAGRRQAPVRARLTGQLVEAIDGSAELAVAGRAPEHVQRLTVTDARLATLGREDARAGALATGLSSLLAGAGLLAVLLVGIPAVHSGALPGVLLAALAFLFMAAGEAIVPLPAAARRLRSCVAAATRLEEINELEPLIVDPPAPRRVSGGGTLAVDGVRMRYGAGEPFVLDGADFELAPLEHVALVGPSGIGKTTLAELLVRFLDPDEGRITLDGIDIRELAQDDLRREVLLCGQDAHLFNTTVRENLLIARRDAAPEELWAVLGDVELDGFVAGLPEGLDTMVGEEGALLSGGQRQRLALARALLSDSRFLILDEPTVHLDAPLAARVMANVQARTAGRAALVITHASEHLDGFDRVVRVHSGTLESEPVPAGATR